MCGRFTLTTPSDELAEYFRVLEGGLPSARGRLRPRYNIAPTQPVACVRRGPGAEGGPEDSPNESGNELLEMRWGLIPYWAKEPSIGNRMINARSETVAEKSAYKEPFRRRRCLVIADGFYEWQKTESGKQPYYIYLDEHRPFGFAGLWERWKPRGDQLDEIAAPGRPDVPLSEDGRVVSCAILTTDANEMLADIHDRMPVILPREHWDTWLDPDVDDAEALGELLGPYPADRMDAHPVSTHVNKPANDDARCIEPLKRLRIVRPDDERDGARGPTQEPLF